MKGKSLLVGVILSGCLLLGKQAPTKQVVSAEAKESIASTQETQPRMELESTSISKTVAESITNVSSIEETKSSEPVESQVSTKLSVEATAESSAASVIVPESAAKVQTVLPAEKDEENDPFLVTKSQSTASFIQTIGKDAQLIAWNEGLYASVMIAQAILETGSGNSQLARPPYHNLFGIKGSYQGKQVRFATKEDKGNGELYTIQSAFRQYPSYKESLEDYAALLKKGISGNASFYQGTWKTNAGTYQEAAKALTGKYATDTAYDKKLTALIEAYRLTSFDQDPATTNEVEQAQPIEDATKQESISEGKQEIKDSSERSEQELLVNQTEQPVIVVPPAAQRPAKQLAGNRIVQ